jgi:hypothetical protein
MLTIWRPWHMKLCVTSVCCALHHLVTWGWQGEIHKCDDDISVVSSAFSVMNLLWQGSCFSCLPFSLLPTHWMYTVWNFSPDGIPLCCKMCIISAASQSQNGWKEAGSMHKGHAISAQALANIRISWKCEMFTKWLSDLLSLLPNEHEVQCSYSLGLLSLPTNVKVQNALNCTFTSSHVLIAWCLWTGATLPLWENQKLNLQGVPFKMQP